MADTPAAASFFRYQDENGGVHVVDSLDNVPARFRKQAHKITLQPTAPTPLGDKVGAQATDLANGAATQVYKATEVTYGVLNRTPLAGYFSAPGASATAGGLLAVGVTWAVLRRRGPLWLKLLLGFAALGLGGGA